jgi:hypothetical protein
LARYGTRITALGRWEQYFAEPFENLWTSPGSGPSLVLNTTSTTGGDRIPISDLSTRDWPFTSRGPCKVNIAEHVRLPLSAAANASARFPLIEDWGSFNVQRDSRDADAQALCNPQEAVADGGFIDNYGATTVYDTLDALGRLTDKSLPLHLIVIQITSDPDCRLAEALDSDSQTAGTCKEQVSKLLTSERIRLFSGIGVFLRFWWRTILHPMHYYDNLNQELKSFRERLLLPDVKSPEEPGPLGVLMNARTVSGFNAALALRCKAKMMGGSYYYFSMSGAFDNPLGWSLSASARAQLDGMLKDGPNARAMEAFVAELKGGRSHVPEKCD